jgi:CheY-like chemotaxis protein
VPGKVLIADDQLKVQKEFTQLLQAAGVEVVAVSNGEHAVRKLASVQPDIVLADIFMPVRDGYEVCEHIKGQAEFSKVRVLLLVSKMEPFDDKKAQRVGADGKIEKPMGDPAAAQAALAAIQQHLDAVLGAKPAPAIDEFAAAVPAEGEAAAAPEPEPEAFATGPAPVSFDASPAETPMGFADVVEEPAAGAVEASEEPSLDLSGATMLTTADDLKRRIEESRSGKAAPPPAEEVAEAQVVEEAAPAEIVPTQEPPAPEPPPAAEKPELAAAWEMTGPPPGAPALPTGKGWDSQWSGGEEAAAAEAPAEPAEAAAEAPAADSPPARPYAPEEFAAAMSAALSSQPATPPPAASSASSGFDPALIDEITNKVMQRITPMVIEAIAREFVRPLVESVLERDYEKD